MNDEWATQEFRQSVINKINEILQNTGRDPTQNGSNMESHIFSKAKSREEYLSLFAKIMMHFKDMRNRAGKAQQAPPQVNDMVNPNMMPDPINALQNLASQGTRNPQMMPIGNQSNQMASGPAVAGNAAASNLLQNLNQQQRPGQQQMQNMQGIRNQMIVPMGNNLQQANVGPNPMGPQIAGNMNTMNPSMNINGMGNQPNQMGNCLPGQIPPNQMQLNSNLQGQMMNSLNVGQMPLSNMNQNQMNMGMNHPQMGQMMNRMGNNSQINIVSNNVNHNTMSNQINVQQNISNLPNQSQMHPSAVNTVPQVGISPNAGPINAQGNINPMISMPTMHGQKQTGMAMGQGANMFQVNRNVGQNQFLRQSPSPTVTSPAGMNQQQAQLPNPQMIPSPALVPTSSPQMPNMMNNNKRPLRQSPNAPLNTPGQVTASSPFNPQEDQIYREKYKKLSKYIEPLRRMVAKIGNDDVENITKINTLLEILCNPLQRIPLDTLLKCEKALENMDLKSYFSQPQFGTPNHLIEVINAVLQNPIANHTLYRTFHPALESLFGSDIKCGPSAPKQRKVCNEDNQEISHTLQGEIARLDQKFKISLDPSSQNNNKSIKLICCLDDKRLPCVPPICVSIPEDYPFTSPNCSLTSQEYLATSFLITVQKVLAARITKLPRIHSLSHILDTWEMSVRQACSPSVSLDVTDLASFLCA